MNPRRCSVGRSGSAVLLNANVPRLIRISAALACVSVAALVDVDFQPRISAAQQRLDFDRQTLRSNEEAFAAEPRVAREDAAMTAKYGRLLRENPQAAFLRSLVRIASKDHIRILAATAADADETSWTSAAPSPDSFAPLRYSVEMAGSYRALLAAVADMSRGPELVRVKTPSLARYESMLTATVPIELLLPTQRREPSKEGAL